jgi:cell division protein FtsA
MSAIRLEIETHIVTASATAVRNLAKCVQARQRQDRRAGGRSLASAETVLSDTEKELGCRRGRYRRRHDRPGALPGRLAVQDGVLPVGGNNVTNDVAIGLKTSLQVAEELKIQHGSCDLSTVAGDEMISVSMLGEAAGRTVSRLDVCRIIEARMRETFEMIAAEIRLRRRGDAAGRTGPDGRRFAACRGGGSGSRSAEHARPRRRTNGRRRA